MPICQKCGYELVLLSSRPKYKCSLCSKLYPQKEVEAKEFRIKNKLQKELDLQNIKIEYEKEWKQFKEIKKGVQRLFKGPLKTPKDYWKNYFIKNKPKREKWVKDNKLEKDYLVKLKHRLHHYRQRQKKLALLYLKSCKEKLSTNEIFKSPPTFYIPNYCLFRYL